MKVEEKGGQFLKRLSLVEVEGVGLDEGEKQAVKLREASLELF